MKAELPYAEDAKVTQKAQKREIKDSFFGLFCDFCVTFASSAYGCPYSWIKK